MTKRWPRLNVGLIEGRSVTSSYHADIISGSQWCHFHCRTMDKTLIWATVLFLSAIMPRKVVQVNFFVFFFCHICRTTVCSGPEILLPCMMRDVTTYLLYSPFFSTIISGPCYWPPNRWPLNGGPTVMLLLLLTYYTDRSRGDTPPPPSFLWNFVASASLPLSDFSGSALELETFWSTIRWLNNGRKV